MAQAWPGPAQAQPGARFWKSGNLEIQRFGIQKIKKYKFSKFKSVLPKMSARSGLDEKRLSRPHLGPSQAIFPWTGNIEKCIWVLLFSLVGQWALFTRFEPLLLSTWDRFEWSGEMGSCHYALDDTSRWPRTGWILSVGLPRKVGNNSAILTSGNPEMWDPKN